MIYALKLLFPTLVVCAAAWFVLRASFAPLLTKVQYQRAWFIMVLATVIVFLGHTTMLYAIAIGLLALVGQSMLGGGARGKLAAFMLLIMILPPLTWQIGGVGDINYILGLTGPRILALVLLPGLALQFLGDRTFKRPPWVTWIDLAVFGYQFLRIALMVPHTNVTGLLRMFVESLLDVLLPYYVVSRGIRSEADLRFLLSHLALGFSLVACIGFAEYFIHRNLYSELQWLYGYKWQLTMTLMRGESLRVQAATPQPIVLAFEMIFALGLWTYLRGYEWKRWPVFGVYAVMTCCLLFTFSRGPLLCGIVLAISLLALRRLQIKTFVGMFLILLVGAVIAKSVGADEVMIRGLGVVFGSSAEDLSSINYRRELLDTALALLHQSPWLGVPDYASQMQALRQGEGIIDLVNSYIAIALDAGVIGLVIYLVPYAVVFNRLVRVSGISNQRAGEAGAGWFAAAFVAMMIALLLTIFTTSTFSTMPFLLAMLLALPIARLSIKADTVDLPLEMPSNRGYGLDNHPSIPR